MYLPFDIPERTDFTDEEYGVLGRALAVATEYECNCRALAALLGLKAQPEILDDEEMKRNFFDSIWKRGLHKNIDKIIGKPTLLDEIHSKLDAGRDARNYVAHEAAIGVGRILGSDFDREQRVKLLSEKVRAIAEANQIILIMSQSFTNEPIPTASFLRSYSDRIVEWVCDSDFDG